MYALGPRPEGVPGLCDQAEDDQPDQEDCPSHLQEQWTHNSSGIDVTVSPFDDFSQKSAPASLSPTVPT